MSAFSAQALEEKISRLSLSQDSIETLSLWITQYKAHANDSVQVWLEETKKADADKRLVLFYLANDILQNCQRRESALFLEVFQDALRHAVSLIGGQKIQTSVERMFRIWKERKVYSNAFLKELELLIEPVRKTQVNEALPDFKLPLLQDALSEFGKFEAELKVKSSHLSNLRVDISNPTASLSMLKDKSAGGRVSQHFEEAAQKLQDYSECLVIEVNERITILDMLKECKIFATYRLAELQRVITDYQALGESVKDLKGKIDQRVKDLERAKSTATSDPGAKEDITDVGDMEIESDGESQEQQNTAQLVTNAPGMIMTPPSMATYPRPPHQNLLNENYMQQRPNSYRASQQQMPRTRLGMAPPFQRFNRPTFGPGGGRNMVQRPLPPHQHPAPQRLPPQRLPPQRFQGRPQSNEYRTMHPPRGVRPPFRPPPRPQTPAPTRPHTISSSPVLYNRLQNEPSPAAKESTDTTLVSVADLKADAKLSLDERLKDMMLNKKFGDSMLTKQDNSSSAGDHVVTSSLTNDQMDEDSQSLPTPSSDSPEEASPKTPKPNMDNPILQALYKSQTSPDHKSSSLVPDYDQEDDELSSSDLKNILDQVKSSEPADSVEPENPPLAAGGTQPLQNAGQAAVARAKKMPEIKITPTLTNLLDEIFPKISQSLINRKRQQDGLQNDVAKVPRLAGSPPGGPRMPPPQFPASSGPGFRQPFERARFPPPARMPLSSTPPAQVSAPAQVPLSSASGRMPFSSTPPAQVPLSSAPVRMPFSSTPPAQVSAPVRMPFSSTPPALPSPSGRMPFSPTPPALSSRMPFSSLSAPARMPFSSTPPSMHSMAKPREEFPRPFSLYEMERPRVQLANHMRFGTPSLVQNLMGVVPRMRTYGAPRPYRAPPPPPGYRPRYA